jgi:phosphoribosylformimino-5-aminoimidazole carboxamide ribotide isomerase
MKLFPAIDLYNQQVVRLEKGKFNTVTVYNNNPLKVAQTYQKEGATWLHVIDLNGAETGENTNFTIIKQLVENTDLKIQVGGGIRSTKRIKDYLEIGVSRVIIGSFAVKNIELLDELFKEYPSQIVVSVDSDKNKVTYSGWQDTSEYTTLEFCQLLESKGAKTIVYTDIAKDGMMQGPNFQDYELLSNNTSLDIIASGGVSSYDDIKQLNAMTLYGAIIGKALYIDKMTVKETLLCLQEE